MADQTSSAYNIDPEKKRLFRDIPEACFYDSQGYLPSRNAQSLDDYLRESSKKMDLLQNTHHIIDADHLVQVASPSATSEFITKFKTAPLPALVVNEEGFAKLHPEPKPPKQLSKIYSITFPFRSVGTVICLDKELDYYLPLCLNTRTENLWNETINHESVHAIRNQWLSEPEMRQTFCLEEAVAYAVNQCPTLASKNIVRNSIDYQLMRFRATSWFDIVTATNLAFNTVATYFAYKLGNPVFYLNLAAEAFIIYSALRSKLPDLTQTLYQSIYAQCVMQKADQEGINPHYLFLRTNFTEFNLRQPLEEQIAKKQGVKWEIMRARLNIPQYCQVH